MSISVQEAKDLITELKEKELALGERSSEQICDHLKHIYGAAYMARVIALKIPEINSEQIYVSTLLHDIGRLEEPREHRFHGIIGYEKLKNKDEHAARTALIHMFPCNKLPPFEFCTEIFFGNHADYEFVSKYIENIQINEDDMLIQLADCLANKDGFVPLNQRFKEYQERHHIKLPKEEIDRRYQLKFYFDRRIGRSVYRFFPKKPLDKDLSYQHYF